MGILAINLKHYHANDGKTKALGGILNAAELSLLLSRTMMSLLFSTTFISKIELLRFMKLSGVVVSGLGEGAFFMSMPHYSREIKKKLGFESYPGTLNIKADKIFSFENLNPIRIEGYSSNGKKFGGAACYRAKLKNIH